MDCAKKHTGLTIFFIHSNTVLYPYATERSLFSWHTLVEVSMIASGHPAETDSRPGVLLERWHYKEDRNNLLRSQTPVITYQPWVEFCHGCPSLTHTGNRGPW